MDTADLAIVGDPSRARDTVAAALIDRGFRLVWTEPWSGVATKGSRTKQAVLGAFAVYFEVRFSVFVAENVTVVRLSRPSSGFTGGWVGRAKAKNQFTSLVGELAGTFQGNGVLLSPFDRRE